MSIEKRLDALEAQAAADTEADDSDAHLRRLSMDELRAYRDLLVKMDAAPRLASGEYDESVLTIDERADLDALQRKMER